MQEGLLREIAGEFLVPFFSGAMLQDHADGSTPLDRTVAFLDPQSIAFKVRKADKYRLILTRSQPFAQTGAAAVPEIALVRSFVRVLSPMEAALGTGMKDDLLSTFQRRIVARALGSTTRERALLSGIDLLIGWASRLYEGAPISASIGFRQRASDEDAVQLADLRSSDFAAVISNGHDTLLEFDFNGRLIAHVSLDGGGTVPSFCPFREAPIAEWTTKDERRVAFVLNRLGEILAFRDKQLLFARRSSRWSFLTHEPIIAQMGTPHDKAIRRTIYETCLDASFARRGACIGVVSGSHGTGWTKIVVDPGDQLRVRGSVKTRAAAAMIQGRAFQKLDRRLRQELVAIDGATVLSHKGEVLAVGAIVKIPGGSTGGGRLAAAKALSALGMGIKVSQDGGITGFRRGLKEAAFRLM